MCVWLESILLDVVVAPCHREPSEIYLQTSSHMKTNTSFLVNCINTCTVCIFYPLQIIPLTLHFCWLTFIWCYKSSSVSMAPYHTPCFWWKLHFDRVSQEMLCLSCQMCCLPTAPSGRPSRRLSVGSMGKRSTKLCRLCVKRWCRG